jgi:3-hydroxyacyl-CoA dehydrogenase/enoyl-CoA hydratase/3-hydroxybutyryl-CoA epimerase
MINTISRDYLGAGDSRPAAPAVPRPREGTNQTSSTTGTNRRGCISRQVDADGICHLVFDAPGSTANVFHRDALLELQEHVAWLERAGNIRGVILRSAKPRIFIAGADLKGLLNATAIEIDEMVGLGQRVFTGLSRLPMTKVAAIHGACLGGGFELALACDRRIASDDAATKIGLPETQLGLVPAWGGCTRLPRLIGVKRAATVILKGTQFFAAAARKHGLVDEVVPAHCLVKHARELIMRGPPRRRPSRHFEAWAAPVVWMLARRRLSRETRGNYPALFKALRLVCLSAFRSTARSLADERRTFQKLVHHADTRNLIRLFFAREKARKTHTGEPAREIKHVAVVGAGVMGSGITCWLATRGHPVLLLDIDHAALARARQRIESSLAESRQRGLIDSARVRHALDRVTLALNDVPLRRADLVIEAAVEDAEIKRQLFADLERRARTDALIATNTSAIPVGSLSDDPRVVGLHFFNPVHAMPLVEIVRPRHASGESIATAVRFVQEIGKIPLVVADSPGFLVNRVLMPYLLDAARLVQDGVGARLIDDAMRDFGMPMGPLRVLDEVGLDVALHVARTLEAAFPRQAAVPSYLDEWVKSGRLGRKSGRGFHAYNGRREHPAVAGSDLGDVEEVSRRLSLLLTNEAARCLDDGVVKSASEVDFGIVLGTGYAPFRGGPLRHADACGPGLVFGQLHHLENDHGSLFTPASSIQTLAENGGTFFAKEDDHEPANACEI